MRTEVTEADTIDKAVQRILKELKEDDGDAARSGSTTTTTTRHNVIYFDGWDGLGASAVLREVGQRLTTGGEFSQVIHINCSKWESRRATQRALTEQLQLPIGVMQMFDTQDEDDDYNGVAQGSRLEIPKVAKEIYQHVQKQLGRRFLVIFNNGSCEEINLDSIGFPLSGYSRNKLLWSFQGGFRLYPRTEVNRALESIRTTDIVLSDASSNLEEYYFSQILRHEAEEVAGGMTSIGGIDWPAAAANCFLYTMRLCSMGGHYDLATHVCNYWKCDGVIQLNQRDADADALWLSCDALRREMQLDANYHDQRQHSPSPVARRLHERIACWTSPTYGSMLIPSNQSGRIPEGMFQPFDKLRVLKLSACMFSFKSPPFLCCHSLRFLWLDHCQDDERSSDGVGDEEDIRRCFQRLWVLDMRYSNSTFLSTKMMSFMTQLRELNVMGQDIESMDALQGWLPNARKLQVKSSTTDPEIYLSGMDKLELLDFSGNSWNESLSVESSCNSLETIIIGGSVSLRKISLQGCAMLKNLLLSGSFPDLCSLDLTGTAVKTLDLSELTAPKLDELFLLNCGKLFAILWPSQVEDKRKRYLGKLHVDTFQEAGTPAGDTRSRSPAAFGWCISLRDPRILRSLEPVKDYFGPNNVHVEISTTVCSNADAGGSKDVGNKSSSEWQVQVNLQEIKGSDDGATYDSAIMCVCPPAPPVSSQGCYVHIEDKMMGTGLQTASHITVPRFVCDAAKILHVHDSLFVTEICENPLSSTWNQLEWCRVERCTKLKSIFSGISGVDNFNKLKTIWASHLPKAHILVRSVRMETRVFNDLTLLHLYCCPRLTHVVSLRSRPATFESLETLEIMWCDNLRVIFDLATTLYAFHKTILFPKLKHVHLHELPKLRGICPVRTGTVYAPMLETVKVRGCWSLMTLLDVGGKNVVECDCEKEWWDRLWWGSRAPQRSHYKPIHSRYYKKPMLRPSPLR